VRQLYYCILASFLRARSRACRASLYRKFLEPPSTTYDMQKYSDLGNSPSKGPKPHQEMVHGGPSGPWWSRVAQVAPRSPGWPTVTRRPRRLVTVARIMVNISEGAKNLWARKNRFCHVAAQVNHCAQLGNNRPCMKNKKYA